LVLTSFCLFQQLQRHQKYSLEIDFFGRTIIFHLNFGIFHFFRHSDFREFSCDDCGKQFKRKDKLKEHVKRMHSGEKKIKIEIAKRQKAAAQQAKNAAAKFIPKVKIPEILFLSNEYKEKYIFLF